LTFRFELSSDTAWASKGYCVAWDQIAIAEKDLSLNPVEPVHADYKVNSMESPNHLRMLTMHGDKVLCEVAINRASGMVDSFRYESREYLLQPLALNFWRAPTDNDLGWKMPARLGEWRAAGEHAKVLSVTASSSSASTAMVDVELELTEVDAQASLHYRLDSAGRLAVAFKFSRPPSSCMPPRVGMQCAIPDEFNQVRWYGRGPHENYIDRLESAALGIYCSEVERWTHRYPRPQESGNRTGVRWGELTAADGEGLRISAASCPLNLSAWGYQQRDLEKCAYPHELPRREAITLNIDCRQIGVGGDNSWGLPVHDKYMIPSDDACEYAFYMQPIIKSTKDLRDTSKYEAVGLDF
jgi:beta-galactosidase